MSFDSSLEDCLADPSALLLTSKYKLQSGEGSHIQPLLRDDILWLVTIGDVPLHATKIVSVMDGCVVATVSNPLFKRLVSLVS